MTETPSGDIFADALRNQQGLTHLFDDLITDPERPASMIAWEEDRARGEFFADAMQEALNRSGYDPGAAAVVTALTEQANPKGTRS